MKTMRGRLIDYIRVKKIASAADISRVFKVTPANARHHLSTLEDEGIVMLTDTHVHGRGRPTQLFGLTHEIKRHNLDLLANAILIELFTNLSVDERENVIRRIANRLQIRCEKKQGSLTHQLTHVIHQLNEMNYQARWEANILGPRILIAHCPYASVVSAHPEICKMDTYLLENMIGQPVSLETQTGKILCGDFLCVFRL